MSSTQKSLLSWCLIFALAGGGSYYFAKEQDRIRGLYGDNPQQITVATLAKKGYGDNIWLDLTDVELGEKYVIESKSGKFNAVWVPAFPLGQGQNAKTIDVLLRSTKVDNDAQIDEKFGDKSKFRGAVINPTLLTPYDPYRTLLQQQYPDMTLAPTIWEVDIDYTEKPGEEWAKRFYWGALGLGGLGVLLAVAFCFSLVAKK